jgi:hypothetical protein
MEKIKMTEEQINIAIAESCGWWDCKMVSDDPMGRPKGVDNMFLHLPDYCNDLNAMAEAEKCLRGTDEQYHTDVAIHRRWKEYQSFLIERYMASATARQRAEAFLKVLGKWKEHK